MAWRNYLSYFSEDVRFKKGNFDLTGARKFQVEAEGHETFESELSVSAEEDHRSVNDKSPIEVQVRQIPSM